MGLVNLAWYTKAGNGKMKNGSKTETRLEINLLMGQGFKLGFVPFFIFLLPVLVTSVDLSSMIFDICRFSDRSLLRFHQCGLIYFLAVCFSSPLCESTGVTAIRSLSWTKLYQQNL